MQNCNDSAFFIMSLTPSYVYHMYFEFHDRFLENKNYHEYIISKDARVSRWYATFAINGRFKLGEPAIATNLYESHDYVKDIVKGRFELGELVLSTNKSYFRLYILCFNHDYKLYYKFI